MEFIYKWLPIIMGCHQRADRSFYYKGKKFPVCARCTGIISGAVLAVLTILFFRLEIKYCFILMIPLIIDGTVQRFSKYESTNLRRLITGILFGYGAVCIVLRSFVIVYRSGFKFGMDIKK